MDPFENLIGEEITAMGTATAAAAEGEGLVGVIRGEVRALQERVESLQELFQSQNRDAQRTREHILVASGALQAMQYLLRTHRGEAADGGESSTVGAEDAAAEAEAVL
jgi:hypothetical protein